MPPPSDRFPGLPTTQQPHSPTLKPHPGHMALGVEGELGLGGGDVNDLRNHPPDTDHRPKPKPRPCARLGALAKKGSQSLVAWPKISTPPLNGSTPKQVRQGRPLQTSRRLLGVVMAFVAPTLLLNARRSRRKDTVFGGPTKGKKRKSQQGKQKNPSPPGASASASLREENWGVFHSSSCDACRLWATH